MPLYSQSTSNFKSIETISVFTREDVHYSKYFNKQIAYRHLLNLEDGSKIEASAYQHFLDGSPTALAIDISTMIGCPMRCKFCASGSLTYLRTLTVSEIVSQVVILANQYDFPRFPQIMCSYQGIGEPSLIAERILDSSRHLLTLDPRILISIATIGTRLSAFRVWRESGIPISNLQISSSGTTSEQINSIMPRSSSIEELIQEAVLCALHPNFTQVKFNYVLISGFNDSQEDLQRLISLFSGTSLVVKISALNPTHVSRRNQLTPGTLTRAQEMSNSLQANGINSFVYGSFNETNVGCGQLAYLDNRNEHDK